MTRRHVAGKRRRPVALPGAGKASGFAGLTLDQLITIWRLTRGGLLVADAMQLTGVKVHSKAAQAAADHFDALLTTSLPIDGRVRCCGCGALLVAVPCVACGGAKESYRMPQVRGANGHV